MDLRTDNAFRWLGHCLRSDLRSTFEKRLTALHCPLGHSTSFTHLADRRRRRARRIRTTDCRVGSRLVGHHARYVVPYWRRKSAVSLRDMTGTDYRLPTQPGVPCVAQPAA